MRPILVLTSMLASMPALAQAPDATAIVRGAIDHWRGQSSYSELTMRIHRPDWERSMTLAAWTKGEEQSLVRVLEPQKDRGNATLIDGDSMWTFSPKVNRVIKIPSSMMGQSWMGSDFSNRDIARADDIVDQYDHALLATRQEDGVTVHEIEAVPHERAPVVWGREVLSIREDKVLVGHDFYDQDGVLVKSLETLEVGELDGRMTAIRQRMTRADAPGEWTEIHVLEADYGADIAGHVFTLSNLRNPRDF